MSDEQRKTDFTDEEIDEWFAEEEQVGEEEASSSVSESAAEKYARSQLRVVRETKDYQLDYLRHALKPGRELIDTAPAYQRRLRWPRKKRSLLIESFLLNIPIPPIFLFEHDYNEYEVIDGRQRLETIRDYLANNFSLAGLEFWKELNSLRFNDLPPVLQKGLLRRSLPAVVLLAETRSADEDDLDVRRVLFDRLNTGGIKLNPQELRNALNPGEFNAFLIRLARSGPFTRTWRIPPYTEGEESDPPDDLKKNSLYKSMADAELVLRFFALKDAVETGERGSLRRILDRYMEKMAERAQQDAGILPPMEEQFKNLLERFLDLFDQKPFRIPKTGRPSRPLYDALMIALSKKPDSDLSEDAGEIEVRLESALAAPEKYDILVGRGNTIEAIHARVHLAEQILWGDIPG